MSFVPVLRIHLFDFQCYFSDRSISFPVWYVFCCPLRKDFSAELSFQLTIAALWVASLSKCDNLFSRPRNRSSRPSTWLHPLPRPGCTRFLSAVRHRTVVRLTALTLRHHYDVNEREVSILAGLGWPVHYFPWSGIVRRPGTDVPAKNIIELVRVISNCPRSMMYRWFSIYFRPYLFHLSLYPILWIVISRTVVRVFEKPWTEG